MAGLSDLIKRARAAGLPVELHVDGEPATLPAGVDLAAYRVVQEALTNTLKHAGPARAKVQVRWSEDRLELVVTDTGRGPADIDDDDTGHGLVGMRERVRMYGGELSHGPTRGGGFEVRAVLPRAHGEVAA
jgi:signal transduction histidine kinase